jgi:hypothetical protein
MASTVVMLLPKPISALPSSIARTLAMPAPGMACTDTPGSARSQASFMAPPSGIHDPPCGPVMKRYFSAVTGTLAITPIARTAANAAIAFWVIVVSLMNSLPSFGAGLD